MRDAKPILFSTPMVQAIMAGKKTQTRRIIKNQQSIDERGLRTTDVLFEDYHGNMYTPKYQVDDILWVRETFYAWGYSGYWLKETGKKEWQFQDLTLSMKKDYLHFDTPPKQVYSRKNLGVGYHKRPSLFMPRAACRHFLRVTKVRAERLNDISEEDAKAEGVVRVADYGNTGYMHYGFPDSAFSDIDAVFSFETLWESINGTGSWEENPWVWVYDFERTDKPTNF